MPSNLDEEARKRAHDVMELIIAAGADHAARNVRGKNAVERQGIIWSIGLAPPAPPEFARTLEPPR